MCCSPCGHRELDVAELIRGIDVRWAPQLPWKPGPGAGGKHVGSY